MHNVLCALRDPCRNGTTHHSKRLSIDKIEQLVKMMSMSTHEAQKLESLLTRHRHPKQQHVRQLLRRQLLGGELKPGDPLPSEPTLAASLHVARGTLRLALASLEQEGLIRRVRGKGTFLCDIEESKAEDTIEVFALIVPQTLAGHYPAMLHGFEGAASKSNHRVIVSKTDNDVARQGNIILHLTEIQVAGVAMVQSNASPTPPFQIQALRRKGIPVVFCHRPVDGISAPLVSLPYESVGAMAGELLAEQGHRRVAMFSARRDRTCEVFLQGLRDVLHPVGGDVPEEFVYTGTTTSTDVARQEDAICEALERMLSGPERPTAIMTALDSLGEMVYLLAGQMGLNIPEDLSLVSFGGSDRQGAIIRRLKSVTLDGAEVGRQAVRLLEEMRDGTRPLDNDEVIEMPLGLSDGETLGPPAESTVETLALPTGGNSV